jgi:hypothetical protein
VVRAPQASGQFKVRALSRNPGKHRELAEEVGEADLDRPSPIGFPAPDTEYFRTFQSEAVHAFPCSNIQAQSCLCPKLTGTHSQNPKPRSQGRMPLACGISSVLWRYRSRFDVGLVCQLHHRSGRPGAGHPTALMRAVDPRKADVVVHHELPGLGSVVGPGMVELPVVVPVPGHARGVDDRPVGHVPEEASGSSSRFSGLVRGFGEPAPSSTNPWDKELTDHDIN